MNRAALRGGAWFYFALVFVLPAFGEPTEPVDLGRADGALEHGAAELAPVEGGRCRGWPERGRRCAQSDRPCQRSAQDAHSGR